ncbi:raftlin isoform X2 [Megalops cyprinoides]|uniref:raftlin isoform X2 n=1 Tax=Megalops cyprinoides TaxID=118141 RepID=UPI0018644E6B|nr:raftlin isoform X2 [Megalops cyprinoides]
MGCGLRKLRRSDESSPGKIYSTLRRPQVETKVGVAYSYRFLDFLLGSAEVPGSSTPCLSSVRELPGQLQDLYQQGFVLAALHPFVHPCGPPPASLQRQLHRAVLIRLSDSVEECESLRLEMGVCQSPGPFPDTELVQGYVKKVQDAAEQGAMFVGFVQQVALVPGQGEGEDLSLSLHSSPSSILRDEPDRDQSSETPSRAEARDHRAESETGDGYQDTSDPDRDITDPNQDTSDPDRDITDPNQDITDPNQDITDPNQDISDTNQDISDPNREVLQNHGHLSPNNNWVKSPLGEEERTRPTTLLNRVELFSLFNHLGALCPDLVRYYTVKVPLHLVWRDEAIRQVDATWLDHMTQHFTSGASLVDGYFHLGNSTCSDSLPDTVESVFIFQEGAEVGPPTAYDAIVVEQWTIIHGVQVKADYVPLLQSLALYGWRLTCVLPTPIANTNSDGSVSTKQILFLQRPVLHRKKKDPKRLSLGVWSRPGRNCGRDAQKSQSKEKDRDTGTGGDGGERAASETVCRKNDKNRENERMSAEREIEGEEGGGGADQEGSPKLDSSVHLSKEGQEGGDNGESREEPEGGVIRRGWEEAVDEPTEEILEQPMEGEEDVLGESANESTGEVPEPVQPATDTDRSPEAQKL